MKASIETKAGILQTLMLKDRQEIRDIHSTVYNVVALLFTASFAITAFLLGKDKIAFSLPLMCVVTGGLIVLMLWVIFLRLEKDSELKYLPAMATAAILAKALVHGDCLFVF